LVGLEHEADAQLLAGEARKLNRIVEATPEPSLKLGQGKTNLERYSVSPAIGLWRYGSLVVPADIDCGVFSKLELGAQGAAELVDDGGTLLPGGIILLRGAEANVGSYELAWRERALHGGVSTYEAKVFDATGAVLAAGSYRAHGPGTTRRLPFAVSVPSRIAFEFRANEPRSEALSVDETGPPWTLALRAIRIRGLPGSRSWP
jgi:hypothetical protein